MANKKISELQSRTPALSDLMLVGDPSSGYSYKCTVTALATIIETDIADGFVTIGTTQTVSGAKTFSNNLTLTSVANTPTDPDKFLTLNASNVVTYRTGAEVLADIGGQGTITLTTTGTSGAATLVGSTLNIPQYQSVLTNPVTGTGTTNYVTKWTSSSAVGNSQIIDNGTNVGIGTNTPTRTLDVNGIITTNNNLELTSGNPTILWTTSNLRFYNNTNGVVATISSTGQLSLSSIPNATVDTDKFLVSDGGVVKYRTGSEVLSDIGGASSSSISGTTNYIPKFTSSSAIGNSVIYESSSNIGIGTTSPTYKLSVNGGIATTNDVTASTGSLGVLFGTASSALGSSDLGFIVADNNGYGSYNDLIISPRNNGAGNQGNLRVYTSGSERLRISSTGEVGIGTSSPSVASGLGLVLNGQAGQTRLAFKNNYTGDASTDGVQFALIGGSSAFVFQNRESDGYFSFETNGSERLRISSTGDVALGGNFTSINSTLQVTGNAAIGYTSAAPSSGLIVSGNVGIGTSAPAAKLDVQGSSSDQIRLRTAATEYYGIGRNSSTGYLDFYGSQSGYVGYLFGGVNGTRMTLDASGNLGLGVSPSAWGSGFRALQISNSTALYDNNTGNGTFLGSNFYYNGTNNIYINSNTATAYAQYSGQHIWYQAPSGTAGNAISFTQAMTLDASGNLLVGGTSSNGSRLQVTGAATFSSSVTAGGKIFTSASVNDNIIEVINSDATNGYGLYVRGGGTASNRYVARFKNGADSDVMWVGTSNVGIGTTSPTYKLHIVGPNPGVAAFFSNASNADLYVDLTSGVSLISPTTGTLAFGTSSTERMRITSGGNVEINTGSIKTGAPSGGTAKPWKLGEAGVTLGGSNTSGVRVEIDGTVYYLVTGYLP